VNFKGRDLELNFPHSTCLSDLNSSVNEIDFSNRGEFRNLDILNNATRTLSTV